jgi:PAS domain S-box-containing protein
MYTEYMVESICKPSHIALYIIIAGIVLGTVFGINKVERELYISHERHTLEQETISLRARIEQSLNQRLFLVTTLKAHVIANNGEIQQQTFNLLAAALLDESDDIRSIQLAPNAVVTYVQPLEGNEEAMGHDLLNDDDRYVAVARGIESGRYVVAGPLELLQGGTAIIARQPIYLPNVSPTTIQAYADTEFGAFWGFATILIDFDILIGEANIEQLSGTEVSIRGKDGLGNQGDIFYGDISTFESDPVLQSVTLPDGSWQIAIVPVEGWSTTAPIEKPLWILGSLLTVVILILVSFLLATPIRLKRQVDEKTKDLLKFKQTVDSSTDAIEITLPDQTIIYVNKKFEKLTGYSSNELIGQTSNIVSSGQTPERVYKSMWDTLGNGDTFKTSELIKRRKDGSEYTAELSIYTVKEGDESIFYIAIHNDVTEREKINTMKTTFVSMVSHQLKTPSAQIKGFIENMLDGVTGEINEKQKEYLGFILNIAVSNNRLIEDLLNVSRIERGVLKVDCKTESLKVIVERAWGPLSEVASNRDIQLNDRNLHDAEVLVDSTKMTEALRNLMDNAIKFSPDKGVVTVSSTIAGGEVLLRVIDQGSGFPDEVLTEVLEGNRVWSGAVTAGGTGVGLYLAKQFIELQKGEIKVSRENNETHVVIKIIHG